MALCEVLLKLFSFLVVAQAASMVEVDVEVKVDNKKIPIKSEYKPVPTRSLNFYDAIDDDIQRAQYLDDVKIVQSLFRRGEMPKYFANLDDEWHMYVVRFYMHDHALQNNFQISEGDNILELFAKLHKEFNNKGDLKKLIIGSVYVHGKEFLKYVVQDPDFNYSIEDVDEFVNAFIDYTDDAGFAAQTGMTTAQVSLLKEGMRSAFQTPIWNYRTNIKFAHIAVMLSFERKLDSGVMHKILST